MKQQHATLKYQLFGANKTHIKVDAIHNMSLKSEKPHRLPIVERGGWQMRAQRRAAAVIVTRLCKKEDPRGTGSGILHVVCSVLSAADIKLKASHMKLKASHMKLKASHMKLKASHMKLKASHMQLKASHIPPPCPPILPLLIN